MKIFLPAIVFGSLLVPFTRVGAVTREECKEDYLPPVLECIDSFAGQGTPDCDLLPIPDFAMPPLAVNELGYWMRHLRNTVTSHVFAVSENAYSSLILVDVPPVEVSRERKLTSGGNLKGTTFYRNLDEDEDGLMAGPPEESEDERIGAATGITVAFVDAPPSFQQFDENGNDAGSHLISAMEDILVMLDATVDDISQFVMIYTHAHSDHIGLANHTLTYVTETLGFDPADVPIIASEGLLEQFEHAIESGYFTYRAPLPTMTFTGFATYTIGQSTPLNMTTFNGHTFGDKDTIVFMESLGPENPAIMMVVDYIFPKWSPFFSFAVSSDLLAYMSAHDTLLEFPLGEDGFLVGGHLTQIGDRNDIYLNKNLTLSIVNAAGFALATVNAGAIVGGTGAFTPGDPNFGNTWNGFGAYFKEIERVCAREVLAEYGCDFGGLDVTVYSHCLVAQYFWRLEI